jgi:serine/threonine-protein kinase RsbW
VIERRTAVPGETAQLPALTRFLQEFWAAANLPATDASTFELALEEVFMNVVSHGSPEGAVPWVEVSLTLLEDGLTMTVEDNGPQFDPTTLPPPDVTASLSERPVGGLGVFLVQQMMDAITYHRIGACNRLRMTKYIAS